MIMHDIGQKNDGKACSAMFFELLLGERRRVWQRAFFPAKWRTKPKYQLL
jgi:hypothetical protein